MQDARDTGRTRAIPQPSRRFMLTGSAAALIAGAAIATEAHGAPAGADAELIRLLDTLKRQDATIAAIEAEGRAITGGISAASRGQERRLDKAADERAETIDTIIATPATTPAGMRAKAEAVGLVVLAYAYLDDGDTLETIAKQGDTPDRIALSLARDVLAGRASA